jgi:hypothetical protein
MLLTWFFKAKNSAVHELLAAGNKRPYEPTGCNLRGSAGRPARNQWKVA